jgi:hypothetical protein
MMDELVVVGGLVPSLIIDQSALSPGTAAHVGTMDLDVGLTLAIFDEKRYEALAERLRRAGLVPDVNDEGRLTHQRWKVKDCEKVTVDFLNHDGLGPRRVSEFINGAANDEIQADVVGFVRILLRGLGE